MRNHTGPLVLMVAAVAWSAAVVRTPAIAADGPTGASANAPFPWRIAEVWLEPDGKELFSHGGSILTWDAMLDTKPDSPLGRYVAQLRQWGFNRVAFYCDPEANPKAMRSFCHYLKKNGLGMLIRRDWHEIETGKSWPVSQGDARPRSSPKLSPYNEQVRAYWEQRVKKDYQMMPDLAGYRMNGTEFYVINGAPWMGEGREVNAKTGRQCTRDAIRLMANLLAKRGGELFWETCQDDPVGQRQEFHYFRDMTGQIPNNSLVLIKQYYWDYHPGWPRHPLFDVITKDDKGRSPYVTSIQQPCEYCGVHEFPRCLVEDFSAAFRDAYATGQQGIWVMAMPHPDGWDHPLNLVNWYAIQRLLRDPLADPASMKLEWAGETFGKEAAAAVVAMLDRVTEASRGMYEFDALWTACHSQFPTLDYLDSHLCGPYRQTPRMKGMMGLVLPLDMYSPTRAAEIRANPQIRMVFNQCPITPTLKAEAMAQKDRAVRSMEEAIALWRSLAGRISAEPHRKILAGLEGNLNDTIIFRHMMDLYMDWKLGVLTEAQIDAALAACRDLKGIVVPSPLDPAPKKITISESASLKSFAEQLRRDLREPWVEAYWRKNPLGAGVLEPIEYPDKKDTP
jgi:hypothetical protein